MSSDVLLLPDIYIHNFGDDSKQTWHVIKTNIRSSSSSSSKKGLLLRRECVLEPKLPQMPTDIISFSSAAMGSTIFVTGGYLNIPIDPYVFFRPNPCINKVYYIDTDDPNPEWKEGPSMILARHDHYSFAHEGKVHVLSGHSFRSPVDEYGTQLFAEVYDPASGEGWKELARARSGDDDVAHKTVVGHAVVEHGSRKKILFHAFRSERLYGILLGYDKIWFYDDGFHHMIHTSAFVDGILYYLNDTDMQQIYAYDVDEPGSLHKLVIFDQKRKNCLPYRGSWDEPMPSSFLLSLGNRNLAVIWAHQHYTGSNPSLLVHCSVLEMSKVDDCFKARILDYSNYVMRPGTLECCVAVWPLHREDGKVGQNTEIPNKQCKSKNKRNRKKKRRREEKRKKGIMDEEMSVTAS